MGGLVLSRRIGESIMIGDDIEIVPVKVKGGKIHFHIDAPREIPVHRREVYERIQEKKKNGQNI